MPISPIESSPNVRELMRLHVEALFTHDALGQLLRGNEPSGADAPRFFLGRTADGSVIRFRHDVDDNMRRELEAAANHDTATALDSPANASRYEGILARAAPVRNTWAGPAFSFPAGLSAPSDSILVTDDSVQVLDAYLRDWIADARIGEPMFAQLVDGHAVSVCCTVRRTGEAHEAGVETVPAFRGPRVRSAGRGRLGARSA